MPSTSPTTPAEPITVPSLLIVARDQLELWQALLEEFKDRGEFDVLRDRRQGGRRQAVQPVTADRRGIDRRSLPRLADDPRLQKYVLVRPPYRRPHD
jgi:hypothetical protein